MLLAMKYFHAHYLNTVYTKVIQIFWSWFNYISAKLWKIEISRACIFRGKTIFRTLPNSTIKIGKRCIFNSSHRSNLIGIYSPCMISTIQRDAQIIIGNDCGFSGTVIAAALSIKLGNHVRCGANTLITDSDWHTDDYRVGLDKEVIIEDNVWLGYGVKVLKGVHIGKNSVIGAGSIVTKNIPANVIAAGNPCTVIKKIYNE